MTVWDVAIVGAGPAGALAAAQVAAAGRRVLLLDKARFPRDKVCGCCLQPAALRALEEADLGGLVRDRGARPLSSLRLFAGGRRATLALAGGVALSRRALDDALVAAAVRRGAAFRDRTAVTLGGVVDRARELHLGGGERIRARLVLAADGLGGGLAGVPVRVAARSRLGAGVVLESGAAYAPGCVHMACARDGYVGVVRVEGGRLAVAAALAPGFVRRRGGVAAAAAHVLEEAGLPALPSGAPWRGTPLLTRRPARRYAERVLLLGDAAGYVEPFTGEGIAWALASACAVAPLAARGWTAGAGARWERTHARLIRRRQRLCRAVAFGLRHPRLVRGIVGVLERAPRLAQPFVRVAAQGATP